MATRSVGQFANCGQLRRTVALDCYRNSGGPRPAPLPNQQNFALFAGVPLERRLVRVSKWRSASDAVIAT